jgi:hypothetical protein
MYFPLQIFFLGLTALSLGIWALVDSDALKEFIGVIDEDFSINIFGLAAFVIIFVSLAITGIAFFGCCGAIKESRQDTNHKLTIYPV